MRDGSIDLFDLFDLRSFLASFRRHHLPTMNHYASEDGRGFWHQPTRKDKASLSSTATCVASIVRADLWNASDRGWGKSKDIVARLLDRPWESAGLKPDNPFSLAFIAEGVLEIAQVEGIDNYATELRTVRDKIVPLLIKAIETDGAVLSEVGSVDIDPYPPSAYLTQLAYRVIVRALDDQWKRAALSRSVRSWARGEIHRQVALIATGGRIADPMQLGYAIVLWSAASSDEFTAPEEKALVRQALELFFSKQNSDGTWPPSQPLFHYPDVGNAQCYEYELLTQMLACEPLQDDLLRYVSHLRLAAEQLEQNSFDLGSNEAGTCMGWASGHHPQIAGPESWSTASVYEFVHVLDRLVAEAIRRALFKEIRQPYMVPTKHRPVSEKPFASGMLDADVQVDKHTESLKALLENRFVRPIASERDKVAHGGSLSKSTPMSAILYGPPGTSKTQLAKYIGEYLGWPLLSVDPSYLVQDGLENLYARANRLFSMLATAEQVVVLLDEFDEMGRARTASSDLLSRFITTSMLPKLVAINDERKIVFLLATNYVSNFDAAFSRGGRFDMILPVMQPSLEAKMGYAPWTPTIERLLEQEKGTRKEELREAVADLTFLETKNLIALLQTIESVDAWSDRAMDVAKRATLRSDNEGKTWKQTLADQAHYLRLPAAP